MSRQPGLLPVDPDELAACVACGLCLAYCPTYRVSGEESLSPRGRIAAMRAVDAGSSPSKAFERIIDTCVLCRACETACPSAVPFGRLMEGTRNAITGRAVPWWERAGYRLLGRRSLLRALTFAAAVAQRAGLVPRRFGLPRLALRPRRPAPTGGDVWLFTGCVTDAWLPQVHGAVLAVLAAMGVGVALPGPAASCCGALARHAGLREQAVRSGRRVMSAFPGSAPIVVDSAGCGAALKEYGDLMGTAEAHAFSSRVYDVHEWVASRLEKLPAPSPGHRPPSVAVQDPCHLLHAQRAAAPVRVVLSPYAQLVELSDEGRCCGAGGAYSLLQPELASAIRDQKVAVINGLGADVVASANPGCAMWLGAAGLEVLHPMQIVARSAGLE